MKGYTIILLLCTACMLLLPLPALPRDNTAVTAPTDTVPTASTATPATTTTAPRSEQEPSFRILVGDTVVELEEREFLIRTLAYEMSPGYHEEALKAQAVAAYTYHARRRAIQQKTPDPTLKGADFATADSTFPGNYTTVGLRAKWGDSYTAHYQKLCAAVDAVIGKTITHDGALIDACYFAISSGSTEDAATLWGNDIPYLRSVASPGDRLAPDYQTTVTLTADEMRQKLSAIDGVTLGDDPAAWIGTPAYSTAGTVTAVTVGGKTLTGTDLRSALGLRSACFSCTYQGGSFTVTVRGYGHGVGMSQYGADYLARQGYTWQEILQYYYTGVTVN